jgi:hypothetical protein
VNVTDLRRLLSEATPGPWKGNQTVIWRAGNPQLDEDIAANKGSAGPIIASELHGKSAAWVGSTFGERPVRGANSALIVAAVNALPDLLAVVDAAGIAARSDHAPMFADGAVYRACGCHAHAALRTALREASA